MMLSVVLCDRFYEDRLAILQLATKKEYVRLMLSFGYCNQISLVQIEPF
jgi:hypothetical protein